MLAGLLHLEKSAIIFIKLSKMPVVCALHPCLFLVLKKNKIHNKRNLSNLAREFRIPPVSIGQGTEGEDEEGQGKMIVFDSKILRSQGYPLLTPKRDPDVAKGSLPSWWGGEPLRRIEGEGPAPVSRWLRVFLRERATRVRGMGPAGLP